MADTLSTEPDFKGELVTDARDVRTPDRLLVCDARHFPPQIIARVAINGTVWPPMESADRNAYNTGTLSNLGTGEEREVRVPLVGNGNTIQAHLGVPYGHLIYRDLVTQN